MSLSIVICILPEVHGKNFNESLPDMIHPPGDPTQQKSISFYNQIPHLQNEKNMFNMNAVFHAKYWARNVFSAKRWIHFAKIHWCPYDTPQKKWKQFLPCINVILYRCFFKHVFSFTPHLGKWFNLTCAYVSNGFVKNHQLVIAMSSQNKVIINCYPGVLARVDGKRFLMLALERVAWCWSGEVCFAGTKKQGEHSVGCFVGLSKMHDMTIIIICSFKLWQLCILYTASVCTPWMLASKNGLTFCHRYKPLVQQDRYDELLCIYIRLTSFDKQMDIMLYAYMEHNMYIYIYIIRTPGWFYDCIPHHGLLVRFDQRLVRNPGSAWQRGPKQPAFETLMRKIGAGQFEQPWILIN